MRFSTFICNFSLQRWGIVGVLASLGAWGLFMHEAQNSYRAATHHFARQEIRRFGEFLGLTLQYELAKHFVEQAKGYRASVSLPVSVCREKPGTGDISCIGPAPLLNRVASTAPVLFPNAYGIRLQVLISGHGMPLYLRAEAPHISATAGRNVYLSISSLLTYARQLAAHRMPELYMEIGGIPLHSFRFPETARLDPLYAEWRGNPFPLTVSARVESGTTLYPHRLLHYAGLLGAALILLSWLFCYQLDRHRQFRVVSVPVRPLIKQLSSMLRNGSAMAPLMPLPAGEPATLEETLLQIRCRLKQENHFLELLQIEFDCLYETCLAYGILLEERVLQRQLTAEARLDYDDVMEQAENAKFLSDALRVLRSAELQGRFGLPQTAQHILSEVLLLLEPGFERRNLSWELRADPTPPLSAADSYRLRVILWGLLFAIAEKAGEYARIRCAIRYQHHSVSVAFKISGCRQGDMKPLSVSFPSLRAEEHINLTLIRALLQEWGSVLRCNSTAPGILLLQFCIPPERLLSSGKEGEDQLIQMTDSPASFRREEGQIMLAS